jgi:hypothetical protein
MADSITTNVGDLSANWDWEDKHVMQSFTSPDQDTPQDISVHDIIESGTVLIAAGPGSLGAASADNNTYKVVPIGLIETAQISLNKPLSRIFEIGSKLSYIIPGRTVGGISLSRVFFDGPSIMKALYFGEVKQDYADQMHKFAKMASDPKYNFNGGTTPSEEYRRFQNIGSGNMAMNLASTFFDSPMGLCFFFKDTSSDMVSQTYFEGCRISTFNLGISAGMNVLTEAVNIEFVRVRPILTASSNGGAGTISDKNIVSETSNTGDL